VLVVALEFYTVGDNMICGITLFGLLRVDAFYELIGTVIFLTDLSIELNPILLLNISLSVFDL
jgi:hypothetical protein